MAQKLEQIIRTEVSYLLMGGRQEDETILVCKLYYWLDLMWTANSLDKVCACTGTLHPQHK